VNCTGTTVAIRRYASRNSCNDTFPSLFVSIEANGTVMPARSPRIWPRAIELR